MKEILGRIKYKDEDDSWINKEEWNSNRGYNTEDKDQV